MHEISPSVVSLYVVKGANGLYFAGFDSTKGQANFVSTAIEGKKFSNKYDIKLRPEESLVELLVDLSQVAVKVSEPFRPHRRSSKPA